MENGMTDRGRAIIIGGSMAGLFTCLLLRRLGWDAQIYERAEGELAGRGAGIITHPELFETLKAGGVEAGASGMGVNVVDRKTFNADGGLVAECDFPQIVTAWDHIYGLARPAVSDDVYHRGKSLAAFKQTDDGVTAIFTDGTRVTGDLLIGADGFRSKVRQLLAPEIQPQYAGYIAWRGLVAESALAPATREALMRSIAFCLPPREQLLGYPVAGPNNDLRDGHRRYNFVWYRPADEVSVLWDMLSDETGAFHELSISPKLIQRRVSDDMRAAASNLLAPQFQDVIEHTPEPFFQPIYDLKSTRLAFGRVVILGDAAFVARPHVGAGVTKAALDATALAEALSATDHQVAAAVQAFERQRLPVDAKIVERGRDLGRYLQAQMNTAEERRRAEQHRTPAAVMAETASLAFLEA